LPTNRSAALSFVTGLFGFSTNAGRYISVVSQLQRSIARAIYGKEEAIQLALITLFARGHLLIEDVPE